MDLSRLPQFRAEAARSPVRGKVPNTLAAFPADRRVSYLSIDLNIVLPEIAAMEFFWDKLSPGALVVLETNLRLAPPLRGGGGTRRG